MATWEELGEDNRKAAQLLLTEGHFRSSISRAYYAAYSAITAHLVARGVTLPDGRNNPDHVAIPTYVLNNLGLLSQDRRFKLNKAVRRLYRARIEADYIPSRLLDRSHALNVLRDMNSVFLALEKE